MYDISAIVSMIIRSLELKGQDETASVLGKALSFDLQFQYHDNWDGGIDYHVLVFYYDFDEYVLLGDKKQSYTSIAYDALNEFYKDEREVIQGITFESQIAHYLNWKSIAENISKEEILAALNSEMETLIAAGTGEIIIKGTEADSEYKSLHRQVSIWLKQLGIARSQSFSSLWEWYSYYSNTLSSYQERRVHIHSIYDPLIEKISESEDSREQRAEHEAINRLQEAMLEVQDISQQAFEEFRRAIKSFRDAGENRSDERARKDAVRSVASAMEAVIKVLGGTDDIKTSSRALRDSSLWGADETVKEGDAIFNTLHRLYSDLRHGSRETSVLSFEDAVYWVGRMTNYISYMRSRKSSMEASK